MVFCHVMGAKPEEYKHLRVKRDHLHEDANKNHERRQLLPIWVDAEIVEEREETRIFMTKLQTDVL